MTLPRIRTVLPLLAAMAVTLPARADITIPTRTNVYFERTGQPNHEPVSFTVTCFGYDWPPGPTFGRAPGTYSPEPVFSFSATCARYGCEIEQPYYLNYRHIDDCDMTGRAGGTPFRIDNYGASPVDFSTCTDHGGSRRCALRVDLDAGAVTSIRPGDLSPAVLPSTPPARPMEREFVRALLLTLSIELAIVWAAVRLLFHQPGVTSGRLLFAGLVASTLTLPYLWFVLPTFLDASYSTVAGELLVIAVEALILSHLLSIGVVRASVVSLAANAASFLLGLTVL